MSLADLREAAEARRMNMRAVMDRPSQRRCAGNPSAPARAAVKAPMSLRAASSGGGNLHFHGLASRTDTPYQMYDIFGPYSEVVRSGAFENTLKTSNLDVPLVLAHDRMLVLARTTSEIAPLALQETSDGLEADAPDLDPAMPYVSDAAKLINAGLVDEMSFRFSITRGQWSPDWMEYYIEEVDINRGDVAIVGYGANPYTSAEFRGQRDAVRIEHTDAFVLDEYRRIRADMRARGLKPPMALEDLLS